MNPNPSKVAVQNAVTRDEEYKFDNKVTLLDDAIMFQRAINACGRLTIMNIVDIMTSDANI